MHLVPVAKLPPSPICTIPMCTYRRQIIQASETALVCFSVLVNWDVISAMQPYIIEQRSSHQTVNSVFFVLNIHRV